ncbi:MAG: AAA family ATPase [Egibacteraceae bacterium]
MKSVAILTESWSRLTYPAGALLVVAGIPGAGKSTLIRRLFSSQPVRVFDPESIHHRYRSWLGSRVPYRLYRPLVHIEHYARLARAMKRPGSLVIHETATRGWVRRWIARRAQRPAHLLLLDVDLDAARAGQRQRGRQISSKALTRHWQGWQRMRRQLAVDPCRWLRREGYSSAVVVDRAGVVTVRFDRCARAQPPVREPPR